VQTTRRQRLALIILSLIALGLLDRSFADLRLSTFYLIPVACAAWFLGRREGHTIAVLAGAQWLIETLQSHTYPAPYENAALRLGFFLATASVLASLRARSRQQTAVADLTATSLAGGSVGDLMWRAAELVSTNTGADRVRVLEATRDGALFVVRAVVGWPSTLVGSTSGETLSRTRVAIGVPGQTLGILAADPTRGCHFTEDDRRFLGAVASMLAQTLLRHRLETETAKQRVHHVVEMNDHVVQGLAAALYALQTGNHETAERSVEFTLDEARKMMRDLSTAAGPGAALSIADLTRAEPAVLPMGGRRAGQVPTKLRGPKVTVVIADDTPTLRQLVVGILDSFAPGEFQVVAEAEDGIEAVRAVSETTPDVILLDLAMPRMTGLEAIPEIRRLSPRTKVVVFSGFARDQVEADIDAIGADAHVEKGVPGERLVAVIRGVAARPGGLRAVRADRAGPQSQVAP